MISQENTKPQLHSSHLSLLYKCGFKFSRIVIDGDREPATIPLVVGSATHVTVGRNLNNVIQRGSLLPREAVRDFAKDDFIKEWRALPIVLNDQERDQGLDKTRDLAQDVTIRLVTAHHYDVAGLIKPKIIERKWVLEAKDYDYDLAGQIDIDEGFAIRDTKTRKTNLGQNEADSSEQFTIYAMAKYIIDKKMPEYIAQDNIIKPTKTRDAYCETYKTTRTQDDFKVALKRFDQATKIIKAGIYTPADPTNWSCSTSFCGFAADGSCPYFNSKTRKTYIPVGMNSKEGSHGSKAGTGEGIVAALEGIIARDEGNVSGKGNAATR